MWDWLNSVHIGSKGLDDAWNHRYTNRTKLYDVLKHTRILLEKLCPPEARPIASTLWHEPALWFRPVHKCAWAPVKEATPDLYRDQLEVWADAEPLRVRYGGGRASRFVESLDPTLHKLFTLTRRAGISSQLPMRWGEPAYEPGPTGVPCVGTPWPDLYSMDPKFSSTYYDPVVDALKTMASQTTVSPADASRLFDLLSQPLPTIVTSPPPPRPPPTERKRSTKKKDPAATAKPATGKRARSTSVTQVPVTVAPAPSPAPAAPAAPAAAPTPATSVAAPAAAPTPATSVAMPASPAVTASAPVPASPSASAPSPVALDRNAGVSRLPQAQLDALAGVSPGPSQERQLGFRFPFGLSRQRWSRSCPSITP
ncbi:hypothetical protein PINS_up007660 [Pythium insidiosum]|nr:hypothetical protein PINS_up007660 [Pythium insidiosum]